MPPKTQPKRPDTTRAAQRKRIREGHLTPSQVQQLVQGAATLRDRLALKMAYFYGLRASEVGLIPVSALDLEHGTIEIARLKGSKSNVFKLHAWLTVDLEPWLKERSTGSEWLFSHSVEHGAPLDRMSFWRIMQKAAKAAGLPENLRHPHALKHSIATHLMERGGDLLAVQERLGHARIENTMVYAEMTGRGREAGEATLDGVIAEVEDE